MRPRLANQSDLDALWDNLDVIDVFATDHAPHTLSEKDGDNPPPGFPGLESAVPLLLTAVKEKRLSMDELVDRLYRNPKRIFSIPDQPETWIEIDPDEKWTLEAKNMYSRCGWTPFEGLQVTGRVNKVVLRGQNVFLNGEVLAEPGFGKNLRDN